MAVGSVRRLRGEREKGVIAETHTKTTPVWTKYMINQLTIPFMLRMIRSKQFQYGARMYA